METALLVGSHFDQAGFMPHGHCYLWRPELVWLHVVSDLIIGLAYVSISVTLYALVRKIKLPFSGMFLAFGVFIFACGATHFMEVWTMWKPDYWFSGLVKFITAFASIATAVYLFPVSPRVVRIAKEAKLAEEHRVKLASYSEELERRVRERTAELEAALRLRDDFISIAAHELRTPLTTAQLRIDSIRRQLRLGKLQADEPVKMALEAAGEQTHQIASLTNQLLDVSRLSAGHLTIAPEEFDLAQLLRSLRQQFQEVALDRGSDLKITLGQEPIMVRLDSMRIEQVVANLVSNAVRYGEGKPIEIFASQTPAGVVFGVRDLGIGVAKANQEKIFEKFERAGADRSTGGLGLGLYIARQIIELHGGILTVVSEPGAGATFTAEIPPA